MNADERQLLIDVKTLLNRFPPIQSVVPPLSLDQAGLGQVLRVDLLPQMFWAQITASSAVSTGSGFGSLNSGEIDKDIRVYSWVERTQFSTRERRGAWANGQRSGTLNAYLVEPTTGVGTAAIPNNSLVLMWLGSDRQSYQFMPFLGAYPDEGYTNGLIAEFLEDICIDPSANTSGGSAPTSGGDNSGVWWVVCVVPRTGDSPTIFESATTPAINYSAIYGPFGSYAEAAAKAAEVTPCPGGSGSSGEFGPPLSSGIEDGSGGSTSGSTAPAPADSTGYVLRKTYRRLQFPGWVKNLGTYCKRVTICKGSCPKPTVQVCNPLASNYQLTNIPETLTATLTVETLCDPGNVNGTGCCNALGGVSVELYYDPLSVQPTWRTVSPVFVNGCPVGVGVILTFYQNPGGGTCSYEAGADIGLTGLVASENCGTIAPDGISHPLYWCLSGTGEQTGGTASLSNLTSIDPVLLSFVCNAALGPQQIRVTITE
jgi:hypothetical protein